MRPSPAGWAPKPHNRRSGQIHHTQSANFRTGEKCGLGRIYAKAKPKYLICDKGTQFWAGGFKKWAKRTGVKLRFGAIDKHGSIAVVKRFIRTLKDECTRKITVPQRREEMRKEFTLYIEWYNKHRPHEFIDGRTPNETYYKHPAANAAPRIEPRSNYPPDSPCATPLTSVEGKLGQKIELVIEYHAGRKHLPIITLKRVA